MTGSIDDFVTQIKEGPHWRLVIRPQPHVDERLPLEECLGTVAAATVHFRGWDFPHFNRRESPEIRVDSVGSADNFRGHLEYWRQFQSGQFVYIASVREWSLGEWGETLRRASERHLNVSESFDWPAVPGFVDLVNFVYIITEFFEFAARLTQALPRAEEVEITVGLYGIGGFVLTTDDQRRSLWEYYASAEDTLERTVSLPLLELVASSHEQALDVIRWFFVRFGWLNPNMESIRRDQEELMRVSR
jgi:hypothetical protein